MKKRMKWVLLVLLVYILGAIIPFIKQADVSDEYKKSHDLEKFYSKDGSELLASIISDNDQALAEKIRSIDEADKKIILSSYRLRADNMGKVYLSSLVNAAKRGVDIKILLDGNSIVVSSQSKKYLRLLDSFDNVDIRIYNPLSLIRPWTLMGRMHDKYMIVDDKITFLGGRNIEDRFLTTKGKFSYDWDIMIYGKKRCENDAIDQLEEYFHAIFDDKNLAKNLDDTLLISNNKNKEKLYKELDQAYIDYVASDDRYIKDKIEIGDMIATNKIQLITNPTGKYSKEPQAFYEISQLMLNSEKKVHIHTPYYIANKMMYNKTAQIASNASTTLFTNSADNNANIIGAGDFLINRRKLNDMGLEILLSTKNQSYHGKVFTIDDNISAIGSFNWDMRSAYIDTELMMVVYGKEFYKEMEEAMAFYEDDAKKIGKNNQIANSSNKPALKANLFKKIISVIVVVLLFPFRFLF